MNHVGHRQVEGKEQLHCGSRLKVSGGICCLENCVDSGELGYWCFAEALDLLSRQRFYENPRLLLYEKQINKKHTETRNKLRMDTPVA